MSAPAIGIDLGCFKSCVAVAEDDGNARVIANEAGDRTTPSYVSYADKEVVVGLSAKQLIARNPTATIKAPTTLLGLSSEEIQQSASHGQCRVVESEGKVFLRVDYKKGTVDMTPTEIASELVSKLKQTAEHHLGQSVSECVVAVPPTITEEQKKALAEACRKAGLEVLRSIDSAVSVALAYGIGQKEPSTPSTVVVFDIGASAVTCSLLKINMGMFTVVKTHRQEGLGGRELESKIVAYLAEDFYRKTKLNPLDNQRAAWRLQNECERVVQVLGSSTTTMASVESLMEGIDLHTSVNRGKLEMLCHGIFGEMLSPVHKVLSETGTDRQQVSKVLLSGGAARLPRIQQMLVEYFGNHIEVLSRIAPEEVVAVGAALQARILHGHGHIYEHEDYTSVPALAASIGLEVADGRVIPLLHKDTPLPARQTWALPVSAHSQTVLLKLYEGENQSTANNRLVSELPATLPENTPCQLTVTVNIENGCNVIVTKAGACEPLASHSISLA